jgi:hypothetical protein
LAIFPPKKKKTILSNLHHNKKSLFSQKNPQNLSKTNAEILERSIRKPMVRESLAGLIYQYYTFSKVAPTKSSTPPHAHTLKTI